MNVTFEPEAEDIEAILQQSAELQSMNEAVDPEAVLYEQDEEDGELVMPLKRKLKEKPGTRKRPAIDMFEAGTDDPATITSTASSTPIVTQQQHRPQRPLTQADYDLSNALSERESILLASAVRKNNQARSTQEQYKAYQKHWNEWCERKRYSDDNTVTREKVLVYVRELLAPKVIIDEENPHLSVLPARVHKTESYEGDYPAYPTIAFYLKGIRDLYIQQCSDNNVAANVIGTTRVPEVIALLDGYRKEHHKRTSSQDVLQLTVGAGYPLSMFKKFMKISWSRSYKHLSAVSRTQKLVGARNRLCFAFNHFMITRGQSIRDALVSHLFPHHFATAGNGHQFALGIVIAIPQGKMNNDHTLHSVFIRNKDVEICPVGCLAFYLFEQWMTKESTPNFRMHDWKSQYLVHASDKYKAMDAATLYRSLSEVMKLAHYTSSKVTHSGRKAGAQHAQANGAQHAQANGASIEDIAQHGNWNHRRLVTHYLSPVAQTVPFKMAGFLHENEDFWLPRNTVIPPVELQKQIFPFIEELFPDNVDWARWMENVMMDRPEDLNRPDNESVPYPAEYIPAMRIMLILAHLRKVILQDAVALMACNGDPLCIYSQHHVFTSNPVFSSQLFQEFSLRLHDAMQKTQSPTNDSLRFNAPVIHQELQAIKSSVSSLDHYVRDDFMGALQATAENSNAGWSRTCSHMHREMITIVQGLQTVMSNLTKTTARSFGHLASDMENEHRILTQQEQRQAKEQEQQLNDLIHHIPPRQHLQEQPRGFEQRGMDALEQQPEQDERPGQDEQPGQNEQLDQVDPEVQEQEEDGGINEAMETMKLECLADKIAETYLQLPIDQVRAAAPNFSMLSRVTPLFPLWDEWFTAQGAKPSIWSLNRFQKDWRKGWNPNLRNQYMLKRRIIFATLAEVLKTEGPTLNDRVIKAKTTMDTAIRQAGSSNAYFKSIQKKKGK